MSSLSMSPIFDFYLSNCVTLSSLPLFHTRNLLPLSKFLLRSFSYLFVKSIFSSSIFTLLRGTSPSLTAVWQRASRSAWATCRPAWRGSWATPSAPSMAPTSVSTWQVRYFSVYTSLSVFLSVYNLTYPLTLLHGVGRIYLSWLITPGSMAPLPISLSLTLFSLSRTNSLLLTGEGSDIFPVLIEYPWFHGTLSRSDAAALVLHASVTGKLHGIVFLPVKKRFLLTEIDCLGKFVDNY